MNASAPSIDSNSPEAVVQRQLDAYNAHDLDALLATYAADACQHQFPATLLARGQAEIRARMAARFADPALHARLLQRSVLGQIVIDREQLTQSTPHGSQQTELVATYEVRDGRIQNSTVALGATSAAPADAGPTAATSTAAPSGLLLFAHGARDPRWALPFEAVKARVRAASANTPVVLGFLEFMQPGLVDAGVQLAAAGCAKVDVVPLFLGAGGHVRKDLPALLDQLRALHPEVDWQLRPAIGEVASVVDAMAAAALAAGTEAATQTGTGAA